MTYLSKNRLQAFANLPSITPKVPREIRQPSRPGTATIPIPMAVSMRLKPYIINDSRIAIIAEQSRLHGGGEVEEITSAHSSIPVSSMALIVVSYGSDPLRLQAGKRAVGRLNRADPQPGRKIFLEAGSTHFSYLKDLGWEYHTYQMNDRMQGLFQKEPLWNIGTNLAFQYSDINEVVLVDADCAFHDNSWTQLVHGTLENYSFVQPFASIYYSDQKDQGMNTGTIPSLAYCIHTNQQHWLAVPGGAYACTRTFFYDILHGAWPTNPVGSGDDRFWKYLYGHTPIVSSKAMIDQNPSGRYDSFKVGYTSLLLNHYYHGPMSNRMYCNRGYICNRCLTGSETILNQDGLLEWAPNKIGKIMQRSMNSLIKNTNDYIQTGRRFTVTDTKAMFKRICQDELGKIDNTHPLKIVTSFRRYGKHDRSKIAMLKGLLKGVFQCPYTFRVATNDPTWPTEERIYCDIPSDCIPVGYEWIMATSIDTSDGSSILYLDPNIALTGTCNMSPCSADEVYIARYNNAWCTKIMYFKDLTFVYRAFKEKMNDKEYNPGKLYSDSVNYLIATITSITNKKLRDVLFHIDYQIKDSEPVRVANILI